MIVCGRSHAEHADLQWSAIWVMSSLSRIKLAIGHLLVLFWIVDLLGKLWYVRFRLGCQAGCP
jgi:hypothetical protein